MNKTILSLSVSAMFSLNAHADILISEYIEGSAFNKAIEIANTGEQPVTLAGYELAKSANGNSDWGNRLSLAGITIAAGDVYVLAHRDANADILSKANMTDTNVINFNGDDPVALLLNGNVHDIIGVMGDQNFAKDVTLIRQNLTASAVYNESDWEVKAKDNSDGLGSLASSDGGSDNGGEPITIIESTIMVLQGNSWSSPYTDPENEKYISAETFLIEGIVTAIQANALGNDLPQGFFIQDEQGDNDVTTSDGIYVSGFITGLSIGDRVAVTGKVEEDYGWTKIQPTNVDVIGHGTIPVTNVRTDSNDVDFDFSLERHEGMLVNIDQQADMYVARTYGFDYGPFRNNMVIAKSGLNLHPNQLNIPASTAAQAQIDDNEDRRIIVETMVKAPNGVPLWYPTFGQDNGTGTTDDYIRNGDLVNGLQGVLGYSYSDFRLYITNQADAQTFIHSNPRLPRPDVSGEGLRIATFNVLNYFNSPFDGDSNPTGTNRGATTYAEFQLQGDKIAAAIVAMDADIIGLMEIENNGFGDSSAVAHLVDKVNALLPESEQYTFVTSPDNAGFIGSDAIANQVIYKPSMVTLDTYRVIKMPEQHAGQTGNENGDNYQRDAITPTFKVNGTEELVTVSVNHFKSKGSTCWEDVAIQNGEDVGFQGSCEHLRVSAAQHLGNEMALIAGNKLIIGDLNAYGQEDPLLVLTTMPENHSVMPARMTYIGDEPMAGSNPNAISDSFGFVNVISDQYPAAYSYIYNDTVGTLDYILVDSTTASKVVDANVWNINASESKLFEYSSKYTGDLTKYTDLFRSSDHEPAIVILDVLGDADLPDQPTPPSGTDDATSDDDEEWYGGSTGLLSFGLLTGFALFRRFARQSV